MAANLASENLRAVWGDIKEKLTKDGQQALNPTLSLMLMTLKGCME